jgi:hypothetical protein
MPKDYPIRFNLFHFGFPSAYRVHKLTANLRRDASVKFTFEQIHDGFLLFYRHVLFISDIKYFTFAQILTRTDAITRSSRGDRF